MKAWWISAVLLLACGENGLAPRSDAGAPDAGSLDAGSVDAAADAADASRADSGEFITSEGRPEICGNAVDDDMNGTVDDGCECALGLVRACWFGPVDAQSVGACHDGEQACEAMGAVARWGACTGSTLPTLEVAATGMDEDCDGVVDEPDAVCVPTGNDERSSCGNVRDDDCDTLADCADPDCAGTASCDDGCDSNETVCWGGYDDDCDGALDCDDPDCFESPSCGGDLCPDGTTPIFSDRTFPPRTSGHSGISAGDGNAEQPMTCGDSDCPPGQVEVRPRGLPAICVPPPPPGHCSEGEDPNFQEGAWRCDPPCALIIQYGYLFGYQRHCADQPDESCPMGQVPTFREDLQRWVCDETCDNGTYDRVWLEGQLVCVPC